MSLLIDALKRAEQDKQARPAANESAPARGFELAPIAKPDASAAPSPRAAAGAPPIAPKAAPGPGRRPLLWIGAGLIVLAIAAGGGYVWYSISALTPQPLAQTPRVGPISPPPTASPAAAPPVTASIAPATAPTTTAIAEKPKAVSARRERASDAAPPEPAALLQRAPAVAPRVNPALAAGYQALRDGDLATARRHYTAAYSADGASLDAALGLATLEARSGERDAAVLLYRRALDIDPRNATALAGLAALADNAQGEALEAELRADPARQPVSAPLRFMLGNAHAARGEWRQAQAAYFEAHRLDPANAEIAHNLAVSLDHLGQGAAAAQFYRRALEAARTRDTPIDAAAVERRLAELKDDAPTSWGPPAGR